MNRSFPAALVCLSLGLAGHAAPQPKEIMRHLAVPAREHGYSNFKSQVISSAKQFEAFVKKVEGQTGWNNRAAFLKTFRDARLNFDEECLVLIRHTEGSGSNKVKFAPPELQGRKLACVIDRAVAEIGTDDEADYCFALSVVDRATVREVEVWLRTKGVKEKKAREVLTIPLPGK